MIRSITLFTDLSIASSFPSTWGLITGISEVCRRVLHIGDCEACVSLMQFMADIIPIQFKFQNNAHVLRCKFPDHNTVSIKKCQLTKKCGC